MIVGPGLSWNTLLCFSESVQIKPTTKCKLCGRIQKKNKKSKAENRKKFTRSMQERGLIINKNKAYNDFYEYLLAVSHNTS